MTVKAARKHVGEIDPRWRFHQSFTRSFSWCRSRKLKKIQSSCQSFLRFVICAPKSCLYNVDEIDQGGSRVHHWRKGSEQVDPDREEGPESTPSQRWSKRQPRCERRRHLGCQMYFCKNFIHSLHFKWLGMVLTMTTYLYQIYKLNTDGPRNLRSICWICMLITMYYCMAKKTILSWILSPISTNI